MYLWCLKVYLKLFYFIVGVWIGVDWDEVERGKYDGSYNGQRYFSVR